MKLSTPSFSDQLSLNDTIEYLTQSALVDGIAEFGSRASQDVSAASDYDLLILLTSLPMRVFQLLTTIDGRLADIVLVETETADSLLATGERPTALFEALFARKMQTARIHYDRSGRLHRLQQLVTSPTWDNDPVHRLAVDMLLAACLAGTWRSYFDVRALPWDGEKAALRYWMAHDIGYYQTVQRCLGAGDAQERLVAYRALVQQTIEPIGSILRLGETAVVLAQGAAEWEDVDAILRYWNSLFSS